MEAWARTGDLALDLVSYMEITPGSEGEQTILGPG